MRGPVILTRFEAISAAILKGRSSIQLEVKVDLGCGLFAPHLFSQRNLLAGPLGHEPCCTVSRSLFKVCASQAKSLDCLKLPASTSLFKAGPCISSTFATSPFTSQCSALLESISLHTRTSFSCNRYFQDIQRRVAIANSLIAASTKDTLDSVRGEPHTPHK